MKVKGVDDSTAKEVEGNEDKDPYKYHTARDDFLLAGMIVAVCYYYYFKLHIYTNDDCNDIFFFKLTETPLKFAGSITGLVMVCVYSIHTLF